MEKLYTVEEVAELASVTGRTIRNYLKNGRLVGRKIGGQWRFAEAEVTQLLNGGMPVEPIVAQPAVNSAPVPAPEYTEEPVSLLSYEDEEPVRPVPTPAPAPEIVKPSQTVAEHTSIPEGPTSFTAPVTAPTPPQSQAYYKTPAPLPNPPVPVPEYTQAAVQPQVYTQPAYGHMPQQNPQSAYAQAQNTYAPVQQSVPVPPPPVVPPMPPVPQNATPTAPPINAQATPTTQAAAQSPQAQTAFEEELAVAFSDVARKVTKFMAEIHELSQGPQMCTVIDVNQSLSAAKLASERLCAIANDSSTAEGLLCQAFVEYDDRFYVARYTLFGSTSFLLNCLKLIG